MRINSNDDSILGKKYQFFVFDMDGTLYVQNKWRNHVIKIFLLYYLKHPWKCYEIYVFYVYRKMMEAMPFLQERKCKLIDRQYIQVAEKTHVSAKHVQDIVYKWTIQVSLPYLPVIKEHKLVEFICGLSVDQWAVYSDGPAIEKARAIGLPDGRVYASTDSVINRMKPNPDGLNYILSEAGVEKCNCLFIGNRDDRDGECARRAGVDYLILPSNLILRRLMIANLIETQGKYNGTIN